MDFSGHWTGMHYILRQELFNMKLPKDTRKPKQRKCYHDNASLHQCEEKEGILGSRQKASWTRSMINTLNTRSPFVLVSGKVILAWETEVEHWLHSHLGCHVGLCLQCFWMRIQKQQAGAANTRTTAAPASQLLLLPVASLPVTVSEAGPVCRSSY